jgi:hypothetical protein
MESTIKLLRIDLERMIKCGAKSWFDIGLQYVPAWHVDHYEVKIANKSKWSESKKRYGIK